MQKKSFWLAPRLIHLFFLVIFLIVLRCTYYSFTDGFATSRIEKSISSNRDLALPIPSKALKLNVSEILSQKFFYFTKGSQAYAFSSEDGLYILKLFKSHHMREADWINSLPWFGLFKDFRNHLIEKRRKRINTALTSYMIAAKHLKKECAIIDMQIIPNKALPYKVTIVDNLGQCFPLQLANYGFILQKRAKLIFPELERWIQSDDLDKAKLAISSIVDLLISRSKKKIQDSDPDLHKNAGLIETEAVFIDAGGFHENQALLEPTMLLADITKVTNSLRLWLEKKCPLLALFLIELIDEKVTLATT